jgi:hypothetical protein
MSNTTAIAISAAQPTGLLSWEVIDDFFRKTKNPDHLEFYSSWDPIYAGDDEAKIKLCQVHLSGYICKEYN